MQGYKISEDFGKFVDKTEKTDIMIIYSLWGQKAKNLNMDKNSVL